MRMLRSLLGLLTDRIRRQLRNVPPLRWRPYRSYAFCHCCSPQCLQFHPRTKLPDDALGPQNTMVMIAILSSRLPATFCPGNFPMHGLRLCLTLLLTCWCAETAPGQSLGRWGVPGTMAQFMGYGNSAGHHAPRVRSPSCKPPRVSRITFGPCQCAPPQPIAISGCKHGQCAARVAPPQYLPQYTSQYPQAIAHPQRVPGGVQ